MPGQEHVTADTPTMPHGPSGTTASSDAGPQPFDWLDHPAVTGLIALLAALVFVLARWVTWAHHSLGRFIVVGRHFATPAQLPRGIPVNPKYGNDGQFFYRLALNPLNFHQTAYGITMDRPYRFMRVGYPLLTWVADFGQHLPAPLMLVTINIVAVGAIGYLGGIFARDGGRHALAGLLLPAYFGLITSLARDTAEPLAAACLLGGLLAVRRRRPALAAFLLAFGALTRETVMVAVAAIAVVRVTGIFRGRQRPGRDDLPWVVPAVVFAGWEVVVKAATGSWPLLSDSGRNAGAPFVAPLKALGHNASHINLHHFDQYDVWFLELAILCLFAAVALLSLRSTSAPAHERLAFVLYLIEICVLTPTTWFSLGGDLRSFIEVYLMAVIVLLGTPRRSLPARALPWLAACTLPALIVVTQIRVTSA